jgi:glutamate carboxypeptidase
VKFKNTGGCCDGNNLAAAGLPNVDTLGVLGAHIHTDKEYMLTESLSERTKLSFLLLDKLSREGEQIISANTGKS